MKDFLASLDLSFTLPSNLFPLVEAYATRLGAAIKRASALVVNGAPIIPQAPETDSRLEFQKRWLQAPLSQHSLTYYDCHIIPGTGTILVNSGGKVRFDESGRSRLGATADLSASAAPSAPVKPLWSLWIGYSMNLMVDETSVMNLVKEETINSLDYRFTYIPEDVVLEI